MKLVDMDDASAAIWTDDLFDRSVAADDLIRYIRSSHRAGSFINEERSQVIAVDAEYGVGKTFSLKRLCQQLAKDHPVAYIDAWADDFIGQPIISLAATLKRAFEVNSTDPNAKKKWDEFARKTGHIASIATKGFAKQALGFLISHGAVEGISAITQVNEQTSEDIRDALSESALETVDKANEYGEESARRYLESRISDFNHMKFTIEKLRSSLSNFAKSASTSGKNLPAFIVVDELDRCSPKYAIEFLEEIKHIFSVPEVYFILGLNSRQLAHSVSHAYGVNFDGVRYLERFIDRSYTLPFPNLDRLVEKLYGRITATMPNRELWYPQISTSDGSANLSPHQWIAKLLVSYKITPRTVFRYFDRLRTALALIQHNSVPMIYLCELLAIELGDAGPDRQVDWKFYVRGDYGGAGEWFEGESLFQTMGEAYRLDRRQLERSLGSDTLVSRLLWHFVGSAQEPGAESYDKIISRLSAFEGSGDVNG